MTEHEDFPHYIEVETQPQPDPWAMANAELFKRIQAAENVLLFYADKQNQNEGPYFTAPNGERIRMPSSFAFDSGNRARAYFETWGKR